MLQLTSFCLCMCACIILMHIIIIIFFSECVVMLKKQNVINVWLNELVSKLEKQGITVEKYTNTVTCIIIHNYTFCTPNSSIKEQ